MTTEKIFIGIDNERIELTGEALESFIAERAIRIQEAEAKALEAEAKAAQKAALLERLGISEDEARLLLA
jgi:hypothetical protein